MIESGGLGSLRGGGGSSPHRLRPLPAAYTGAISNPIIGVTGNNSFTVQLFPAWKYLRKYAVRYRGCFKSRIQIPGSHQLSLSRQMKGVARSFVRKVMGGGLREDLQINLVFVGIKKPVVLILGAVFLSFKCHRLHYLVSWLLETGKLNFNCFLIQLNLVQKLVCTL